MQNYTDTEIQQINKELDYIISFLNKNRSVKQIKFLKYVVDQTLKSNTKNLRAYPIAVDGMNFDPSFDVEEDGRIRQIASRLRANLKKIYTDRDSSVQIQIPVNAYIAEFIFTKKTLYHCTTSKKLKQYISNNCVISAPVRGFFNKKSAEHCCDHTSNNIILELQVPVNNTYPLPDNKTPYGLSYWCDKDLKIDYE